MQILQILLETSSVGIGSLQLELGDSLTFLKLHASDFIFSGEPGNIS